MFSFFRRKAEVLDHWIAFADQFQTSPVEFYAAVEKELAARQVPKMEMSQIDFAEGGLLSEKRVYLRMLRERIVFDVCAAPFGSGFFFSCRTAEIPIALKWWHLLLFLFAGWIFTIGLLYLLALVFGWILSFVLLVFLYGTAIYVLRNAVAVGLKDLDTALIKIPVVGPLYEVFFRKETYYRLDSRLCYIHVISNLVKTLAEETAAAQGVKLVQQYELSPILGELYKPSLPSTPLDKFPLPEPPKA